MEPVMLVHGGAAIIAEERINGKATGVQSAAKVGYKVLQNNGSAIDAVEAAIRSMETNEYFNAGFGSVLNLEGQVEMDASIMDGSDLSAGSVAIIKDVEHPISLARLVKDQSPHVLLAGEGASKFAQEHGMEIVSAERLVSDYAKTCLETFIQLGDSVETREMGGTVGAVALDKNGNVAAGTSTGGTNGKLKGRIGDTPIIGGGTYADNRFGAASCTGHGESILRICLSHSMIKEMETGKTPQEAAQLCLEFLKEKTGSTVGVISVSKSGETGIFFHTKMMPWAYIKTGELHSGVLPDEHNCEPLVFDSSCEC